ncbi:MAG: toxin-antitoxin system YwqK family antitoxin [Candidatus Margulisbacteria bacterium]|jgi:antitoxin component YwqK of YwqJK toxin-antitoxin module|nr:toxin-antitoxin system YwqK family antitoxin [Candidatus Margulisiibacteriota bacterium]
MDKVLLYYRQYKDAPEYILAEYISTRKIKISFYKRSPWYFEYEDEQDYKTMDYSCTFKNKDATKFISLFTKNKNPQEFLQRLKAKFAKSTSLENILEFADKHKINYKLYDNYYPEWPENIFPLDYRYKKLYDEKGQFVIPELYEPPQNGIRKLFDSRGNLFLEANYVQGKKNGLCTIYENNKIKKERYYVDDLLSGVYKEYHSNGKVKIEMLYTNGNRDGFAKEYHPNGRIKLDSFFKDDLQECVSNEYYDNGKLKLESTWARDKSEGVVITYDINGNIESKLPRKHGKLDGVIRDYYPNGKLKWVEDYKKGQRHGKSIKYYKSGKIACIQHWRNDKKRNSLGYYQNGNVYYKFLFDKNGKRHGTSKTYHKSGKIRTITIYKNGKVDD